MPRDQANMLQTGPFVRDCEHDCDCQALTCSQLATILAISSPGTVIHQLAFFIIIYY